MYSRCLAVSKFVLRKINFSVWFDQTFLQKILYIAKPPNFPYTSSAVNMLIMNQFHSFTKETKPNKKRKSNPVKLRSRGGGEGEIGAEARSSGGKTEAARSSGAVLRLTSGAVLRSTSGAVLRLTIGAVRSSD